MYLHPKVAWPPATYDVISRKHSNGPSLNLSQNLCEGWMNSYARCWCFILYEKIKKNLMGVGMLPRPLVRARVKFKPKWTNMWKRIVSSKAIRINGLCLFTLFTFDKRFWQTLVYLSGSYRSRRSDILLVKNWINTSAVAQSSSRYWKCRCWNAEMGRLLYG